MRTIIFFLLASLPCSATDSMNIDLYRASSMFGGECTKNHPCADLELFRDATNNAIGNAAIRGASRTDLASLGIPDLDVRLHKLVDGNALVIRNGRYFLGFPVVVGKDRQKVARLARITAKRITPQVASLLSQIRASVPSHEEMAFHLLWSRAMDEMWDSTWQREHRPGTSPPAVEWVMYPEHPFMFGTNYWAADVAVTWNRRTICDSQIVLDSRLLLLKAAWGQKPAADKVEALQRLGLFDARGQFQGFAYHAGDALDKLLKRLTDEYAALVTHAYNYEALSKSLNVPADDLFVILLHETAYAVFENLSRSGKLQIPAALQDGNDASGCRAAMSFLVDRPLVLLEVEDRFEKSGWRGNQETIDACNEALKNDPNSTTALYYLGLSLYQMGKYREALQAFKKEDELTTDSSDSRHVISHIWIGNLYDLLGERGEAIREYQEVLKSGAADTYMNYTGYHIGPTTARKWAEERIKTPYTRH